MAKSRTAPLSRAQLEIMEIVWERGEVTVSEVWEELSRRRGVARNTAQTMMVRMEEKGWLKHRTVRRTFIYSPVVPRKTSLGRTCRHLLETVFRGSTEDLVTAILEDRSLSRQEAERIRAMIDRAEIRKKSRGGRR